MLVRSGTRAGHRRLFTAAVVCVMTVAHAQGQQPPAPGGRGGGRGGNMPPHPPVITATNATGDAAAVLELERKIEEATVKGDTAFAETVLSSDFHFRHGDGWTRGEKTGG